MVDVHKFGNWKFDVGPEGAEKRKHVHVKVPGIGSVKFWLEKDGRPRIDVEPSSAEGDVDSFYQDLLEQIQVYYDDIIANINRHYKGDPNDPVKPTIGQKTKGQNSPKAVAARKATEES
jgi:hypothetical protein